MAIRDPARFPVPGSRIPTNSTCAAISTSTWRSAMDPTSAWGRLRYQGNLELRGLKALPVAFAHRALI